MDEHPRAASRGSNETSVHRSVPTVGTVRKDDRGSASGTMAARRRVRILRLMIARSDERAVARSRTGGAGDAQVVGALLILGGIFWLLQRSGLLELSWQSTLSMLLMTLGLGLVVTARRRGGGGLVFVGIVMSVVLLSTSSIDLGVLSEGVGSRVAVPLSVSEASGGESLGVGEMNVDLRQLDVPESTTAKLKYRMGVGEMVITLPDDIPVRVTASLEGGELDVLDQHRNGGNLSVSVEDPGYRAATRRIEIDITMGFGNIQVARAPF